MRSFNIILLCSALVFGGCRYGESTHSQSHQKDHEHATGENLQDHNKSNEQMNEHSFDELVSHFEDPEREVWQKPDEVIAKLGDIKGKTILDIGAGTGYFSFRMAAKGAHIIAADVDERFLDYISKAKQQNADTPADTLVETRLVPYDSPGLNGQEADAVIIVDTYHHIENRVEYFRKVQQGLKDQGVLMVVDFKKRALPVGPPPEHKLALQVALSELKSCGFVSISTDTVTLPYQYIITAVK